MVRSVTLVTHSASSAWTCTGIWVTANSSVTPSIRMPIIEPPQWSGW